MTALATAVVEQLFIAGRWTETADVGRLDVTNSASGAVIGSVLGAGEVDVSAAIDAAAIMTAEQDMRLGRQADCYRGDGVILDLESCGSESPSTLVE